MMNSKQLREEITKIIGMEINEHGRPDLGIPTRSYYATDEEQLDLIMTAIKNHVDYVIGEDEEAPTSGPLDRNGWSEYDRATASNELRAEQRNRAGGY